MRYLLLTLLLLTFLDHTFAAEAAEADGWETVTNKKDKKNKLDFSDVSQVHAFAVNSLLASPDLNKHILADHLKGSARPGASYFLASNADEVYAILLAALQTEHRIVTHNVVEGRDRRGERTKRLVLDLLIPGARGGLAVATWIGPQGRQVQTNTIRVVLNIKGVRSLDDPAEFVTAYPIEPLRR